MRLKVPMLSKNLSLNHLEFLIGKPRRGIEMNLVDQDLVEHEIQEKHP